MSQSPVIMRHNLCKPVLVCSNGKTFTLSLFERFLLYIHILTVEQLDEIKLQIDKERIRRKHQLHH